MIPLIDMWVELPGGECGRLAARPGQGPSQSSFLVLSLAVRPKDELGAPVVQSHRCHNKRIKSEFSQISAPKIW